MVFSYFKGLKTVFKTPECPDQDRIPVCVCRCVHAGVAPFTILSVFVDRAGQWVCSCNVDSQTSSCARRRDCVYPATHYNNPLNLP